MIMWAEYMLLYTDGQSRTAVELLCNQWLCNSRKPGWSGHFTLLSWGTWQSGLWGGAASSGHGQSLDINLPGYLPPGVICWGVGETHHCNDIAAITY